MLPYDEDEEAANALSIIQTAVQNQLSGAAASEEAEEVAVEEAGEEEEADAVAVIQAAVQNTLAEYNEQGAADDLDLEEVSSSLVDQVLENAIESAPADTLVSSLAEVLLVVVKLTYEETADGEDMEARVWLNTE